MNTIKMIEVAPFGESPVRFFRKEDARAWAERSFGGPLKVIVDEAGVSYFARASHETVAEVYAINEGRTEPLDAECECCSRLATHEPELGNGTSDAFLCDECYESGLAESRT